MNKIQIQLPTPLYKRIKELAKTLDYPMAELLRRGAEQIVSSYQHVSGAGPSDRPPEPLVLGLKIESPEKLRELSHQRD